MGIFGLFGSKKASDDKAQKVIAWRMLTKPEQLEGIVKESATKPVAIFKHSTRCGISRMVLRQFESDYEITEEQMDLYFLDLLSYREVSDEVASRFQIIHQSPQLIVIKNGTTVYDASHHHVRSSALYQFV